MLIYRNITRIGDVASIETDDKFRDLASEQEKVICRLLSEIKLRDDALTHLDLLNQALRNLCDAECEWATHLFVKTKSYYEFIVSENDEEHNRLINNIKLWLEVLKTLARKQEIDGK